MNERQQLEQGIIALQAQRAALGDAVVDAMIAAAREKLAQLVPPTAPRQARTPTTKLKGHRKQVTVIIADVKGSTTLLEQIGSEAWVHLMNRIFQILEAEIYRFGGAVDQFRGDGLVAFFGATVTHEDDPERAILASLAMQSAMRRFATNLRRRQKLKVQLRIGINTGEVIVARVGDVNHHNEDTAMGAAITLAARMESAATPDTILVSANTYRLTHTHFKWQALGKMHAKGIRQALAVYRPLSACVTADHERYMPAPLIGRATELHALTHAIVEVQKGRGGIVTVVGDAGLGKSRLVAEAYHRTIHPQPASQRPQWIEGRCRSFGTSIAYLPWLDIVRGLLNVGTDDDPQTILAKLRQYIAACASSLSRYPERRTNSVTYIGHLMSLPLEVNAQATMAELEGERFKRGTFRAIESLIAGMAQQTPLIIVCEDLHWADPTSLELLERLFRLTRRMPLLFICAMRPESESGALSSRGRNLLQNITTHNNYPTYTDLWLVPLSRNETEALIDELVPTGNMPPQLKKRILNHTEGNPFYVEEIIRALIDSGALRYDAEQKTWHVTRKVVNITIPPTLYGVLMARIDRLPEAARRVLQMAAVIGRIFSYRTLKHLVRDDYPLNDILHILQREDLVHTRPSATVANAASDGMPSGVYIFKHSLIKDVAYQGLLRHEQQTFHRQVACALERASTEREDEPIGVLAHHWRQAKQPEKAIAYLLRAGEQAAAQFANNEAADYYSHALKLLPDDSREHYDALLAREKLHDMLGARDKQAADLRALATLVAAFGDPRRHAEIALRQAHYAEVSGDYPAAIAAGRHAISLAHVARDIRSEAAGYLMWGRALFYQGDNRAAHEQLERARDHAAGFPQIQADVLRSLGIVTGDLDEATDYQEQALHIHRKIGDRRGERAARHNLSDIAITQGYYDQAQRHSEDALQMSREIGDRQGEALALHNLGFIYTELGDYAQAQTYYKQVWRIARKTDGHQAEVHALLALARIARYRQAHARAAHYAAQAVSIALEMDEVRLACDAHLALGHALCQQEALREAAQAYRFVLDADDAHPTSNMASEVTLGALAGLARIALARNNVRTAKSRVASLCVRLRAVDAELLADPSELYLTCVQVLRAARDAPRAQQWLTRAYDDVQARAAQIRNPQARQAFLEKIPAHRKVVALYEGKYIINKIQ